MHLRRALILFALVLGLTAAAASIAPAPDRDARRPPAQPPQAPPAPEEPSITFVAPPGRERPPVRRVSPGSQLVVVIDARTPGQVAIPRLGRTASVTPSAPARFDLLAPDPGRYDVLFTPTSGEPARVGTLVSRLRR